MTIKVTKPSRASNQVLVNVNTKVFDKAFSRDRDMYIGVKGKGGIGKRYEMFDTFVKGGMIDIGGVDIHQDPTPSIESPEVDVDINGNVSFTNGRHRWAWLRDQGAKIIPVAMMKSSVVNAKKFGMI